MSDEIPPGAKAPEEPTVKPKPAPKPPTKAKPSPPPVADPAPVIPPKGSLTAAAAAEVDRLFGFGG